jgi:hypothetical protein
MESDDLFGTALADLGQCILALGKHRQDMVLTGGMVPVFYRHLPHSSPVSQKLLTTLDLDWTVPRKLLQHGTQTVDRLLHGAHFVDVLLGDESRVVYYQHERYGRKTIAPIHIEFLSPRQGSPSGRKGEDRTSIQVQKDLWAQALPYLELLLHEPLEIDAREVPELRISKRCLVRIPNPATYITQKLLARPKRTREKQDKDLAYAFEVATVLRKAWADVGGQLERAETHFSKKWFHDVRSRLRALFSSVTADGPIAVAGQYRDAMGPGAPTEAAVFQVMTRFLDETGFLTAKRGD